MIRITVELDLTEPHDGLTEEIVERLVSQAIDKAMDWSDWMRTQEPEYYIREIDMEATN